MVSCCGVKTFLPLGVTIKDASGKVLHIYVYKCVKNHFKMCGLRGKVNKSIWKEGFSGRM